LFGLVPRGVLALGATAVAIATGDTPPAAATTWAAQRLNAKQFPEMTYRSDTIESDGYEAEFSGPRLK
jgi:polyisoprenoid-binding protein YceI